MSKLKNYENFTYIPGIIHPVNIVSQFKTNKHKKHHKKNMNNLVDLLLCLF